MKNSECALCDLQDGECGRVVLLGECGNLRQRLLDLGFVEGARVKRLFSAPSGNPAAYLIRDAVIALRASDAAGITVMKYVSFQSVTKPQTKQEEDHS